MADPRPELTTTEVRQGDRHTTNKRVLIIGITLVVIAFIAVLIWNTVMTPDTATTLEPGESIQDVPAAAVAPDVSAADEPTTPAAADPAAGELEAAPAQ